MTKDKQKTRVRWTEKRPVHGNLHYHSDKKNLLSIYDSEGNQECSIYS